MVWQIDIDKTGYSSSMMQQLNLYRSDAQQHCDFKVKVGVENLPVHKVVLSAGSDYFKAMLSHDTLENQLGMVEIKEADAECVKKCIDFIYTGKTFVSADDHEQLMYVAHMLQLQKLCDEIAAFLEDGLNEKSFFVTKKLANMYSCKKLEEVCDQFALNNFEAIAEVSDFLQLDQEYVSALVTSRTAVASENAKCHALITWAKHDPENRKDCFVTVAQLLDLSEIDVSYRRYLVEEEPLIGDHRDCSKIFTRSIFDSFHIKSVAFSKKAKRTVIVLFDKISKSLQGFDPRQKSLTKLHDMNEEMLKFNFTAITLGGHIYVLMENRAVYRLEYGAEGTNWHRLADMLENHGRRPPAVVLSGNIYVIGGNYFSSTKFVEMYNPTLDTWTKIKEKSIICRYSAAIAHRGAIYSIGGSSGILFETGYLADVEKFDPTALTWNAVTPMTKARANAGVVEFGDKIYVLGGYNENRHTVAECYDPSKDSWSSAQPMVVPRAGFKAFVIGEVIYALGGSGDETFSIEMCRIADASAKWEVVAKMKNIDPVDTVCIQL